MAGGRRRGLLILLTYGYFVENLLKAAPSALSPILIDEVGLTYSLMGLLISASSLLYGLMQIPSGLLSDTWGPGRTIIGFTLLSILGVASIYLSRGIWMFLLGQMLIGLGFSVHYINSIRLISTHFEAGRRASAIGVFSSAYSLGTSTAYILFPLIISWIGEWRPLYLCLLLILLIGEGFYLLTLRDAKAGGGGGVKPPKRRGRALGERGLLLIILGYALSCFGWIFPSWMPKYLTDVAGLSYMEAGVISSISTMAGIPGCIAIAALSDRIESRRIPAVVTSLLFLTLYIPFILGLADWWMLLTLSAIYGFLGSLWVLPFAMLSEASPEGKAGVAMGVMNTLGILAYTAASPLYGALVDLTGGYRVPLLLASAATLLSALAFYSAPETHAKTDK
ncbi:MAG: MFS transporter [Candidatus Bathyarchaeota archaeon B23]|nr:MAG: MFS transporter [Candidatus Bathyarchaeota archaeon B23]